MWEHFLPIPVYSHPEHGCKKSVTLCLSRRILDGVFECFGTYLDTAWEAR